MKQKHNDDILKTMRGNNKGENENTPATPQPKKQCVINTIKIPVSSKITGRTYRLEIHETLTGFKLVIDSVWTPFIDLIESQ